MRLIAPHRYIPAAFLIFAAGCATTGPVQAPSDECACCAEEEPTPEAPLPPLFTTAPN